LHAAIIAKHKYTHLLHHQMARMNQRAPSCEQIFERCHNKKRIVFL